MFVITAKIQFFVIIKCLSLHFRKKVNNSSVLYVYMVSLVHSLFAISNYSQFQKYIFMKKIDSSKDTSNRLTWNAKFIRYIPYML